MKNILRLLFGAVALLLTACGGDDGWGVKSKDSATDREQNTTNAVIDSMYEYRLPVIFHVLYKDKNDGAQYIVAARLKNILQYVNQIYQGGIYGESANVRLKFVLADKNEAGQTLSTPGVEYVYYPGEYPIDEEKFMSSPDNVKYIWDPNNYINVMLYHFKKNGKNEVLGLSHLPYTIQGDHRLDGLEATKDKYIGKLRLGYPLCSSINSIYAGQSAEGGYYESDRYTHASHRASYITSADVVVTLAHELGHYLGLFHTFSERSSDGSNAEIIGSADSCADTDHCKDTPSYNRTEYDNYIASYMAGRGSGGNDLDKLLKRRACDGTEFYSANIMDYAFTLGYKISHEQKARIRNVLYYSPLIPGPKLNGANEPARSTRETEGKIYTHPRIIR